MRSSARSAMHGIANRLGGQAPLPGLEVLIEAARIRAASAAKLPDAIHIASSSLQAADLVITNDRALKGVLGSKCRTLSELDVE